MAEASGIVYLVGAGPGDPGLITQRGAEVLARADVVAYDRLVHPRLLELAPGAELVDVGKRPGESGSGQVRINDLLVASARAGKTVVRLKGGDPFVFGRGGEEAEVLAAAGVRFEIVPGVTSAVAGPAYAGIPLTHREHASWAVIATGHGSSDGLPLNWDAISHAPTAVFLMGLERLGDIVERLLAAGKPADTPVTVVASATWPHQREVRSVLEKVADAVESAGIEPPAILVVGAVAALGEDLGWLARRPLSGKRVFVTRTRAQSGRLSGLLAEMGAEALEFPAIATTPPSSYSKLDRALERLGQFTWCVFTSPNAAESVWKRLVGTGRDARAFGSCRVAAVGPATASRLRARGIVADLVPSTYTSQDLADALGSPVSSARADVLIPHSESAPNGMVRSLQLAGWRCEAAAAYDTITDAGSLEAGRRALEDGVDAVLFTSGSTVRSFVELWGAPPSGCLVCCIGPRTAEVAGELGLAVDATAEEQTIEGLVDALIEAVGA